MNSITLFKKTGQTFIEDFVSFLGGRGKFSRGLGERFLILREEVLELLLTLVENVVEEFPILEGKVLVFFEIFPCCRDKLSEGLGERFLTL